MKIIITELRDKRPVEDIIWTYEDYKRTFKRSYLELEDSYKPLAKESEPYEWVNETRISPWCIYVLKKSK